MILKSPHWLKVPEWIYLKILCSTYNTIQFSKPLEFTQPVHNTRTLVSSLIFLSDTHSQSSHITKNSWIGRSPTLHLIFRMSSHQRYARSGSSQSLLTLKAQAFQKQIKTLFFRKSNGENLTVLSPQISLSYSIKVLSSGFPYLNQQPSTTMDR